MGGEIANMEYGATHGLNGGDTADIPRGLQGSRDSPQDQADPQSVGYWEAHRPLIGHSGREPIPSARTTRENDKTKARTFN